MREDREECMQPKPVPQKLQWETIQSRQWRQKGNYGGEFRGRAKSFPVSVFGRVRYASQSNLHILKSDTDARSFHFPKGAEYLFNPPEARAVSGERLRTYLEYSARVPAESESVLIICVQTFHISTRPCVQSDSYIHVSPWFIIDLRVARASIDILTE